MPLLHANNSSLDYYRRLWENIHTNAAKATTSQQYKPFYTWIRSLSNQILCGKCKQHMITYIESNPPEKHNNPFMWSWEFHNDVNLRLGKPIMDYSTAVIKYLS